MRSYLSLAANGAALAVAAWVLWAAGANVALRAAPPGVGQAAPVVTHVTTDRGSVATSPMAASVAKSAERAKAVSCLSNAKHICLAVLMYNQDWEEKYPPSATTFKKAVMPYIKNEKAFVCPETGKAYSFNKALEKKGFASVPAPAQTVLIYEGTGGHLSFVHDGAAVVGFADGHCKLITPEAAKKLRWKP